MKQDNWITRAIEKMDAFDRGYEQGASYNYSKVGNDLANAYDEGYEQGGQDMAKKIINEMYNYSKKYTWMCLSPEDIEMFADKYGVEVEE